MIETTLAKLAEVRDELKRLKELDRILTTKLVTSLGLESTDWSYAGKAAKAIVVRPTSLSIDETGLLAALDESMVKRVTKVVLDEKALETAVSEGAIDMELVAEHSTEVARTPYVRLTFEKG
jgi:hypothetical protein